MRPADIQVDKTYYNRIGAGTARRKVVAIGYKYRPHLCFGFDGYKIDEHGVLFEQNGQQKRAFLSRFARWAGGEAADAS